MRTRLWQAAIVLGAAAVLEVLTRGGFIRPSVLPAPDAVLAWLVDAIGQPTTWSHLATTVERLVAGFAMAIAVGLPIGYGLSKTRRFAQSVEPLMASLYAMPWVLLYPLLLVMLGTGSAPIVCIAFILGTIPVALNTYVGFAEVRTNLIKVGRSTGCSQWQIFWHIQCPAALPYVVSGMRLGFIYAFLGVVATEFMASGQGLGFIINFSYFNFQTAAMYGYVIIVVLVTFAFTTALEWFESIAKGRYR